jgi:hypothetical protein
MSKKAERVELDTETWDRIDAAGSQSGQSRDEFIDRAVRRALGGGILDAILQRVRERSDLTSEEAERIAAEETATHRAGNSRPTSQASARES